MFKPVMLQAENALWVMHTRRAITYYQNCELTETLKAIRNMHKIVVLILSLLCATQCSAEGACWRAVPAFLIDNCVFLL